MSLRAASARALLTATLATALWCSAASADVVPGQPDESIGQAYPIAVGLTYRGAFDDTKYDDVDYLAVNVARAGETLEFTVQNTTGACNDPNDAGCPVYATLMDSTDRQVGGDTSDAGTIATVGDTETLDWTFAHAGTYYLLMESNGDLPAGSPSYAVSYHEISGSGSGGASGIVKALRVAPHQHGAAVRATIVLRHRVKRLRVTLLLLRAHRRPALLVRLTLRHLSPGRHRLVIRLPSSYTQRRHYHLSLSLKLTITAPSGAHASFSRPVTLSR
jgi:hypothetical protein